MKKSRSLVVAELENWGLWQFYGRKVKLGMPPQLGFVTGPEEEIYIDDEHAAALDALLTAWRIDPRFAFMQDKVTVVLSLIFAMYVKRPNDPVRLGKAAAKLNPPISSTTEASRIHNLAIEYIASEDSTKKIAQLIELQRDAA